MAALDILGHVAVVNPAPAMTDDFMAVGQKGFDGAGILLKGAHDAKDADLDVELLEGTQNAPHAGAAAIFEHGLDQRYPHADLGRNADIVEHAFGDVVTVRQRGFTAAFVVEIEVDRDPRATGPLR